MKSYDVIRKIVESTRINEDDQVYYISMYLKGWLTAAEIKWIWE